MKRTNKKLLAALLTVAMTLALTACSGEGGFTSDGAAVENPQNSQTEQKASVKEEVVFPELTPLEYWNRVDTFLEANAPADLAEFFQSYETFIYDRNYEEMVVDNFRCLVDKEMGLAVIHSYVGPDDFSGELVIPAEIEGCRVFIGYATDDLPAGTTSLVVEDGVQALINNCSSENLSSVTLPDSLLMLWEGSFGSCPLTEIKLPDSLYVVDACTNTQLTEVVIPENVMYVNGFARTPLTSVSFEGNHVLALGKFAFKNCEQLTDIEIPDSVQYIHPDAFSGSPVTVPADRVFYD